MGLESGSYTAWCFDEAVAYAGSYISGELQSVEGKTAGEIESKRRQKLQQLLAEPGATSTGQYKDPVALFDN